MSEMFDALRKAEEERRKRAGERGRETPASAGAPVGIDPSSLGMRGDLLKEIGILHNSLEGILKGKERRSLLFASSTREEGTTTIALNYGRLLAAQHAEKVLLCEMNARNPAIARMLSMDGSMGVSEVLAGQDELRSVVRYIEELRLYVAQIGTGDAATVQLHLASSFPRLVREALSTYTTVIFDAPPIITSPETPAMGRHVDGVVLVVQAGKTKREVAQRSINTVAQMEGRVLGVVLNRKRYYIPEFIYKRL